jgi:hypothetical protein
MKKRGVIIVAVAAVGLIALGALGAYVSGVPLFSAKEQAVVQAMKDCGMSPTDLRWEIQNGTLFIGSKEPPSTGAKPTDQRCLVGWASENRVKLGFIGYEQRK